MGDSKVILLLLLQQFHGECFNTTSLIGRMIHFASREELAHEVMHLHTWGHAYEEKYGSTLSYFRPFLFLGSFLVVCLFLALDCKLITYIGCRVCVFG